MNIYVTTQVDYILFLYPLIYQGYLEMVFKKPHLSLDLVTGRLVIQ